MDPRPDPQELRAAMLQVDLIALRLRVAMAKADLQLRSARCAALKDSSVARLLSRKAREEQHTYLEELRSAVTQYAHLLETTGASREQVVSLVKETIDEATTLGTSDSKIVSAVISKALQTYRDAPAA
jgi:hypothetical protein